MEGLVSSRGGTTPYRPLCFVFLQRRGKVLYRPLCLVSYTGDGSLPSPVFGFIEQGGTALYHPCVRLYKAVGDCSLPSLVFVFVYHRGGTILYRN